MLVARIEVRPRRAHAFAVCTVVLALARATGAQPVAPSDSLVPSAGVHPLGIRDLWTFERVSDPQPSPDGAWVAYARRVYDAGANTSHSNLWLVPAAGGASRRLTTARAMDTQPRWSPDGRSIAFLSDRGGRTQVWGIDMSGEARPLTDVAVDVESFQWSPSGDRLCFAAGTYPDCPDLECTADRDKKLEDSGMTARIYDDLLFRHWDKWDSGRRVHLFVVPAAGGAPVDLVRGADLDAPPLPSGGVEAYAWSPDGKSVAFQARRRETTSAWTTNLDLYIAAADGSGFRSITESNLAADALPVYAPDGRTIAYLAMARPGYESDRERVTLYQPASSRRRALTETWDRSPTELVWSQSGKRLYVVAPDQGTRRIFAVDASGGNVRRLDVGRSATSLRVSRGKGGERLVFLGESLTSPHEIFSCTPDGRDVRQLTATNTQQLASVRMSKPEEVWYTGAGGARVHAWLHPPVDRREGARYPLLVLVHGGPQGSWENRFSYRWNPQVWAGAGYAVLAPDPRGSIGYGQEFTDAIRNDWGGKCYEDIMLGVEHVVANAPWVDGDRVAAAGGSFGGYMTLWMAGQTDRFRCLVNHAGLFDLESFYASTEEQWFPEWDLGGVPWEMPESYERWSPSKFVQRWKTPMLVTHGARDYRVPEAQGFAAYTTLQRRGVPSQLLHFSDEHHWIQKSRNSILWYDTVISWLDRWCKQASARPGQP